MKNSPILFLLLFLSPACSNKTDADLQPGSYQTFAPISVNGQPLNDKWVITDNGFSIVRGNEVLYQVTGIRNGNRVELFPDGSNPYYGDQDFRGGKIVTVSFGFYFYPDYPSTDITFCLQRIN